MADPQSGTCGLCPLNMRLFILADTKIDIVPCFLHTNQTVTFVDGTGQTNKDVECSGSLDVCKAGPMPMCRYTPSKYMPSNMY